MDSATPGAGSHSDGARHSVQDGPGPVLFESPGSGAQSAAERTKLIMNKSEREIQCEVIRYLRAQSPKILFSATNGGIHCSAFTRGKMVAAGYEKGIPDLIIYEPRGEFHGLCIEFKSKKGRLSEWQDVWLANLSHRGYYTAVERDSTAAIRLIQDYLNQSPYLYTHRSQEPAPRASPSSDTSETHLETTDHRQ